MSKKHRKKKPKINNSSNQQKRTIPDFQWSRNTSYNNTEEQNTSYNNTEEPNMVDCVCNMIYNARDMIIISSFLLADEQIVKALLSATRNSKVRCYLMMAATTHFTQEIKSEFDEKVLERHKNMLNELAGYVLIRSSTNFHAKIIIIDPYYDDPKGLFLTSNLTTEGLIRNQELFVGLNPKQIQQATSILCWAFWEYSEHELIRRQDNLRPCKPLGKILPTNPDGILQTSPNYTTIKNRILEILNKNTKKVIVASFGWDANHKVIEKLCDMAKNGTNVTVLARAKRDSTNKTMMKMTKAGIQIYGFKWLHAKAVITDSDAIIMSANIEEHGLDKGFELGLHLKSQDIKPILTKINGWIENPEYKFKLNKPHV